MEFGRIPDEELSNVDFSLAPEPGENARILGGNRYSGAKVYIGCAKWGRIEWVGKLYPPKAREKDFLKYYVEHYNSIELNITHYKIYGERGTAKWAMLANGRDFKFCPKMFQGVTHRGRLNTKKFMTNEFLRGVAGFKEHLGPVFLQFNETFSPKRKEELYSYLATLPKDLQFFVEVRHRDWFGKIQEKEEFLSFLSENHMGAVITDAAGRRDCVHMRLTIPVGFIRFVGNSLHPTDYSRLDVWVKRIKHWLDNGLQELYFFMHMHDEATSPELTVYLVDKLNRECGLSLNRPKILGTPLSPNRHTGA